MNIFSMPGYGVFTFFLVFAGGAVAAPEIHLESEPLSMIACTASPADKLSATTASLSSSANLQDHPMHFYQAGFNAVTGSGSLKRFQLSFAKNNDGMVSAADWDAADRLTKRTTARRIYTSAMEGNMFVGMPFLWPALSGAQKAMLNRSPVSGADDRLGEKRLDYLRGGRRHEMNRPGGIFPSRAHLLGAIIHSTPRVVGAPPANVQGDDYQAYYNANRTRRPVVYVGVNDGMLHAFDAATGNELFAYIPHAIFERLPALTTARVERTSYVDGEIGVADAIVGDTWRTVLVSGFGRGAQGVFALDVTAPDQFDGMDALWEFTDANDADIGNVIGAPSIAKFRVNVANGVPQYRYFAVVTSGVNNHRDDGTGRFNADGPNVLFLLALDKKKNAPWKDGVNYFKFAMPPGDGSVVNGMTDATLVISDDGVVSRVYAGDMQGNLWRFDFGGDVSWSNTHGDIPSRPLFVAQDANRNRQPITQKPTIVFAPGGGYIVLFGTGKYLERADLQESRYATQSFYGILDTLTDRVSGRNELEERTLVESDVDGPLEIGGNEFRYDMPGTSKGWYFDFMESDETGERSIGAASIFDTQVAFNTLLPSRNPCAHPGGRSYVLNTLTGLPASSGSFTGYPATAGFPGAAALFAATPTETSERDATGKRRVQRKIETIAADPDGEPGSPPMKRTVVETVTVAGRLSWREIVNWLEHRSSFDRK